MLDDVDFTPDVFLLSYWYDYCRHAAKLLKCMCGDQQVREMVKVYDGIPTLLR